jgi:hypothetical protein
MAAEAHGALARRWFDSASNRDSFFGAMQHGDPKIAREIFFRTLIAEVFSSDCIMHFPDGDGNADRILRYHLVLLDAFPDLSFRIEDTIAEGDKVVVRGTMAGEIPVAAAPKGNPGGDNSMVLPAGYTVIRTEHTVRRRPLLIDL